MNSDDKNILAHTARLVDLQENADCPANNHIASVRACDACCSDDENAERDFPSIGSGLVTQLEKREE